MKCSPAQDRPKGIVFIEVFYWRFLLFFFFPPWEVFWWGCPVFLKDAFKFYEFVEKARNWESASCLAKIPVVVTRYSTLNNNKITSVNNFQSFQRGVTPGLFRIQKCTNNVWAPRMSLIKTSLKNPSAKYKVQGVQLTSRVFCFFWAPLDINVLFGVCLVKGRLGHCTAGLSQNSSSLLTARRQILEGHLPHQILRKGSRNSV